MIQSNKIGSNLLWTHKNVALIWDFFNKVLNFFSSHNDRWRSVVSSYIYTRVANVVADHNDLLTQ